QALSRSNMVCISVPPLPELFRCSSIAAGVLKVVPNLEIMTLSKTESRTLTAIEERTNYSNLTPERQQKLQNCKRSRAVHCQGCPHEAGIWQKYYIIRICCPYQRY